MNKINFDLRLFYFPNGLSATFIDGQYKYDRISPEIKAMEGDIVIDAGGCFSDTGLYFAHEVGESGHVYTFEFIPSNLAIMRKNFSLSENLNKRITIIEHPLWHKSKDPLYYMDQGSASFVSADRTNYANEETYTISIDDLVEERHIPNIDFIKVDIEGAELCALRGAVKTIRKFKPKLSIAIYHQIKDFDNIVCFISNLTLDYKFYLGHYTIFAQETILFANPNN